MEHEFQLNDVVEMKKSHPCGTNKWKIIRLGMDIRIKCEGCQHSVLIPRKEFTRKSEEDFIEAGRIILLLFFDFYIILINKKYI